MFVLVTVVDICVKSSIKSLACKVLAGIATLNKIVLVVVLTALAPAMSLPKTIT